MIKFYQKSINFLDKEFSQFVPGLPYLPTNNPGNELLILEGHDLSDYSNFLLLVREVSKHILNSNVCI